LQWRSGEELVESSFADALAAREAGRRYRTAISVELADGLPRILAAAHERLEAVRAGGHRDAGGLVVAADGEHARAVARVLRGITGQVPTVVLHTEARAAEKLHAFTRSSERWIVAVNMVSEGVDIPRLRVGVYATAAKTPLVFRQIVGRFVRTIPGRPREPSFLFLPADPALRAHADDVERELRHVLVPPSDAEAEAFDERPDQRESERGEVEAFVPVAADVAPQLALFGPPGGVPAAAPSAPVASEPEEPGMAAFERRALLREKRHRLVADLRRTQGGSHAEINRWLNRSCGIRRVDDASIDQLEHSIDLLLGRLGSRR
jgi:superfamily II DNA or RNA helicase